MESFWKMVAIILISVILETSVRKQNAEFSILLSMIVCCMGATVLVSLLAPVFRFIKELQTLAELENGWVEILIKCTGIAMATEIVCLFCQDSGCTSLGRITQMLGSAAILYSSLPMITALVTLIRDMLGDI